MVPTPQMTRIKDAGDFIPGTTHYSRRKGDGKFEVVARLTNEAHTALEANCGPEVVLEVCEDRHAALAAVRFFRGHGDNNTKGKPE